VWSRGKLRERAEELRAWGGLILAALSAMVFLGTLSTAQAGTLPRAFLEAFLESRPGIELMERVQLVSPLRPGVARASHLSQALTAEHDLRAVRQLLESRAQLYGEALYARDQGVDIFASTRSMTDWNRVRTRMSRLSEETRESVSARALRNLSAQDREWLIGVMNQEMGDMGLAGILEFLPAGTQDFVQLRRTLTLPRRRLD
jgi:hypothetical protein